MLFIKCFRLLACQLDFFLHCDQETGVFDCFQYRIPSFCKSIWPYQCQCSLQTFLLLFYGNRWYIKIWEKKRQLPCSTFISIATVQCILYCICTIFCSQTIKGQLILLSQYTEGYYPSIKNLHSPFYQPPYFKKARISLQCTTFFTICLIASAKFQSTRGASLHPVLMTNCPKT